MSVLISAALASCKAALVYVQEHHPKFISITHWFNPAFTLGLGFLNHDLTLKVLAFLFVTLPLGVIQWWSLYDRWKERRAKKHGDRA